MRIHHNSNRAHQLQALAWANWHDLHMIARDYRRDGWSLRESVLLAHDHLHPYQNIAA